MTRRNSSKQLGRLPLPQVRRLHLRITIAHITPSIWREVAVPEEFTLDQLHRCIQLSFDWLDYHLYEFQIARRRFRPAHAESEGEEVEGIQLSELKLKSGDRFQYIYDWGDHWEHEIEVNRVEELPLNHELAGIVSLLDGARAAPPEDCGGPPGYEALLATLRGERRAKEASAMRVWAGAHFDPELVDLRALRHSLTLVSAWRAI